ncbi:hypothetical protein FUT87_12810 [Mitsuaria sp. TWR114]|uniref:hypothetical protein n=1 Tax=Mitsuaria sp. TWR114 TaxID=2601731 RepID=UPI0011BE214D|nr:hypothetical protein [Mitsuaria sp. TWR114]TXD86977.1 hypothetical protein FUT87_12810 [Mitsuaria sp. TWR114]
MSRGAALRDPDLAPTVRALPVDNAAFSAVLGQQLQRRVAAWQPGLSLAGVDASGWNAASDIDAKWPTLQAPGAWEARAWPMSTASCGCASASS